MKSSRELKKKKILSTDTYWAEAKTVSDGQLEANDLKSAVAQIWYLKHSSKWDYLEGAQEHVHWESKGERSSQRRLRSGPWGSRRLDNYWITEAGMVVLLNPALPLELLPFTLSSYGTGSVWQEPTFQLHRLSQSIALGP